MLLQKGFDTVAAGRYNGIDMGCNRMKKNDLLEVDITDMGYTGEGIAKPDGFALFVKGGVAGDHAVVRVLKVNRRFGYAKIERLLKPSLLRETPRCPVFGKCGGCQLQHLAYPAQGNLKQTLVENNLYKIGGFVPGSYHMDRILSAEACYAYRNKAQFPVGEHNGSLAFGFYAPHSHVLVPLHDCAIQHPQMVSAAQDTLAALQAAQLPAYDERTHTGLIRQIFVRYGGGKHPLMVCIAANTDKIIPCAAEIAAQLMARGDVAGVVQNCNPCRGNTLLGNHNIILAGEGMLEMQACGLSFLVSPNSFFQVNTAQMERLYQQAAAYAGLDGSQVVYDLYCGVGTISLYLARQAKRVVGVEAVPEAVKDAKQNAMRNGIENAAFYCGDCPDVVRRLVKEGDKPDVVVVDPPRKGCSLELLDLIGGLAPEKLVYISCNSATLARDAAYLKKHGFSLVRCRAVDMFPQTGHVETVALFSLPQNRMGRISAEGGTQDG